MTPDFEYNPRKANRAQEAYAEAHELPVFAPSDGICCHCGRNIYLPIHDVGAKVLGITVQEAASGLITRCPHCSYSFTE